MSRGLCLTHARPVLQASTRAVTPHWTMIILCAARSRRYKCTQVLTPHSHSRRCALRPCTGCVVAVSSEMTQRPVTRAGRNARGIQCERGAWCPNSVRTNCSARKVRLEPHTRCMYVVLLRLWTWSMFLFCGQSGPVGPSLTILRADVVISMTKVRVQSFDRELNSLKRKAA